MDLRRRIGHTARMTNFFAGKLVRQEAERVLSPKYDRAPTRPLSDDRS